MRDNNQSFDSGIASLSGFAFQIKVFILLLGSLQNGERLGFETLDDYNGPRELDHGIEKIREHGIMRLTKGRSENHVIQNVHVGIQGEGSH